LHLPLRFDFYGWKTHYFFAQQPSTSRSLSLQQDYDPTLIIFVPAFYQKITVSENRDFAIYQNLRNNSGRAISAFVFEDEKMSQDSELLELLTEAKASRRNILKRAAAGSIALAAGVILPGCGGHTSNSGSSTSTTPTPTDVLNFALNLEYLEAEYYSYGTTGGGLDASDTGNTSAVITGDVFPTNAKVSFSSYGAIASEIANDELLHVRFLRSALGGSAVKRPPIDLVNSFNAAAKAAGIGSSFNPFASEIDFILGAFIFEDVGVTAYHGGAGYLTSNLTYLSAAAGILGTEAYHAGAIRDIILAAPAAVAQTANQISALRAGADGSGNGGNEVPPGSASAPVLVPADANSITFARTPAEVLSIVYLGTKPYGGFFPSGLAGNIR
jgi:hypothetical protein